jgi:FHS family L-fucose permease-like MFS transporter
MLGSGSDEEPRAGIDAVLETESAWETETDAELPDDGLEDRDLKLEVALHGTPASESDSVGLFVRDGANHLTTFLLICCLFALWGFSNGMIDVMDKHFQDRLHLSKANSAWVQFAHWLGYFVMSLPAGLVADRLGYKVGLLVGLLLIILACLWMVPAAAIDTFGSFLLGIGVLASGLTFLETIANPYTTQLGAPRYAVTRINIAQSCTGLGLIFGPVVGGWFFYAGGSADPPNLVNATLLPVAEESIYIPYLFIAAVVAALFLVFACYRLPDFQSDLAADPASPPLPSAQRYWRQWHFWGGALAQFCYVGAQTCVWAFFINFFVTEVPAVPPWLADWLGSGVGHHPGEPQALYLNERGAAALMGVVGFALFFLGRLTGSMLLVRVDPAPLLAAWGTICTLLMVVVVLKLGWPSGIAVFLSFYFMSIMFPTIFALAIFGLGPDTKIASSFIVMAIVGGAILPKLMGWIADTVDMSTGYLVPGICFFFIALYGFMWRWLYGKSERAPAVIW